MIDAEEWAAAMRLLKDRGLRVLRSPSGTSLVIVRRGVEYPQVPTAQWQRGLTPSRVLALASTPGELAIYLGTDWGMSWLDRARQPRARLAGAGMPGDMLDPWDDAPDDAPQDNGPRRW